MGVSRQLDAELPNLRLIRVSKDWPKPIAEQRTNSLLLTSDSMSQHYMLV
jgi:hypothetical protein